MVMIVKHVPILVQHVPHQIQLALAVPLATIGMEQINVSHVHQLYLVVFIAIITHIALPAKLECMLIQVQINVSVVLLLVLAAQIAPLVRVVN